jgi:hypothetical protein
MCEVTVKRMKKYVDFKAESKEIEVTFLHTTTFPTIWVYI